MTVWGIDPGSTESGYVIIDDNNHILRYGKIPNTHLLHHLTQYKDRNITFIFEMLGTGRIVSKYHLQTAIWIGRMLQVLDKSKWITFQRGAVIKHFGVKCKDAPYPELKGADAKLRAIMLDRWNPPKDLRKDALQALALTTMFLDLNRTGRIDDSKYNSM
jgi:hypothetical protein